MLLLLYIAAGLFDNDRMRALASCCFVLGFIFISGSAASAQSASKILRACETLQRGMHLERTTIFLPPGDDAHQCWGYMNAVLDYAVLANRDGKPLLGACVSAETTAIDIIRLFISYANAHPDKLNLSAAAVAYNAMAEAFPCK
jgi:hypothetical protein